ncbi:hypothetical protein B0H14DRAFT_2572437 [Mycena olivaceomarginata]|nr:hypothetical protein B0H14DRAFT_2572437 [Mycena olivaceomarginata]
MSSPPAVLDVPDAKPANLVAAWKKGQDAAAAASAPLNQCSALNLSLKEKLITEFTDEFKHLEHGRQQEVLAAALRMRPITANNSTEGFWLYDIFQDPYKYCVSQNQAV